MKRILLAFLSVVLVCPGCKKQAEAPPPKSDAPAPASVDSLLNKDGAPPPAAAAPAAPAAPAPGEAPPAGASAQTFEQVASSTEVGDLTRALQIFYNIRHRFPVDLNELSKVSNIRLPAVPPGCSLVIDKDSQSVKLVKRAGP